MKRPCRAARAVLLAAILLPGLGARPGRAEEIHVFPLDGAQMAPPSRSRATGSASVILKGLTGRLRIRWQDLSGRPVRFEIHGPARPGQVGPLLFALAAPRGCSARADSVELSFAVAQSRKKVFRDEETYLSVRTSRFPRGEIRGQIIPTDEENDEDD